MGFPEWLEDELTPAIDRILGSYDERETRIRVEHPGWFEVGLALVVLHGTGNTLSGAGGRLGEGLLVEGVESDSILVRRAFPISRDAFPQTAVAAPIPEGCLLAVGVVARG